MDEIQKNLKLIQEKLKEDKDFVIRIEGSSRMGMSSMALRNIKRGVFK